MVRKRRKQTLLDILAANIARPNRAPAVRIPRANTPRPFPRRTAEFRPTRQSPN